MKKIAVISKAFVVLGLIALSLTSCKDTGKPVDTKEVAKDKNAAQFNEEASEKEATFFITIAEIDLAEIEIAKLAELKTSNAVVKQYAQQLIKNHTQSNAELKTLADKRQLAIPTSITDEGKEKYVNLDKKTGLDFDKAFINAMIDDHKKAIKKMEEASQDNDKDQTVKEWASNKIAGLTDHLQQAKMLKEKLER